MLYLLSMQVLLLYRLIVFINKAQEYLRLQHLQGFFFISGGGPPDPPSEARFAQQPAILSLGNFSLG